MANCAILTLGLLMNIFREEKTDIDHVDLVFQESERKKVFFERKDNISRIFFSFASVDTMAFATPSNIVVLILFVSLMMRFIFETKEKYFSFVFLSWLIDRSFGKASKGTDALLNHHNSGRIFVSITVEWQRRKDQSSIHLFMILLTSIKQLATRKFNEQSVDPWIRSHVNHSPSTQLLSNKIEGVPSQLSSIFTLTPTDNRNKRRATKR